MKTDPPISRLSGGYIFRLVWRGWFAGVSVIFLPLWGFAMLAAFLTGAWSDLPSVALGGLIIPLVAAGQGVIAGGIVLLGIRLWREQPVAAEAGD